MKIAAQDSILRNEKITPYTPPIELPQEGSADFDHVRKAMENNGYDFNSLSHARLSDAVGRRKKGHYAEAATIMYSIKEGQGLQKFPPQDQLLLATCLRYLHLFDKALVECKQVWKFCRTKRDRLLVLKNRIAIYNAKRDYDLALAAKVDCLILEITDLKASINEIEREADSLVKYDISIAHDKKEGTTPSGNPVANRLYKGLLDTLTKKMKRENIRNELLKPLNALARSKKGICTKKAFDDAVKRIKNTNRFNAASISF